jgi:hypothetical protein
VLKYTSIDDELYWRTIDSMLLKCLGEEQAKVAVREVYDEICGAHQSAYKMNWLLQRVGFYWPTMMDDCVKYQKGYEACQRFENIQLALAGVMNSIVKPCCLEDGDWILSVRFIPDHLRGINLYWLLLIISPNGLRQYH